MSMRFVVTRGVVRIVLVLPVLIAAAACATNQGVAPNRAELTRLKENPSASTASASAR